MLGSGSDGDGSDGAVAGGGEGVEQLGAPDEISGQCIDQGDMLVLDDGK